MSVQNRIFALGAMLLTLAGGFWFLVLAPERANVAQVKDQIAQAEARRATAVGSAAAAAQAKAAYQRDYANVARLGKAAPPDDDVASLVFQLEHVARANKIDFRAVNLTGAGAAAAPAPAAPGAAKDASGKDASGRDAAGKDTTAKDPTAPDPTAAPSATPAAPAIAQAPPGAVVGASGLLTLPFTFTFDGGYLPMQRMLGAIDDLADATDGTISVRGRLFTVDGFALSASRDGFPKVKALVSATAYIVPPADKIAAGATPQAPASTSPAMIQGAG